jgi:hypothetical protein
MFVRIFEAFFSLISGTLKLFEESLRIPMSALNIPVPLQTTGLALVPALTLVVVVRMMRGFLRTILVILLLIILGDIVWPEILLVYRWLFVH